MEEARKGSRLDLMSKRARHAGRAVDRERLLELGHDSSQPQLLTLTCSYPRRCFSLAVYTRDFLPPPLRLPAPAARLSLHLSTSLLPETSLTPQGPAQAKILHCPLIIFYTEGPRIA